MDDVGNGAVGVVANNPGTSGTSLQFTTGQGASFPAVVNGYEALVIAAPSVIPQKSAANFEIIRITALSGDNATISRSQESTQAQNIKAGYYVFAGLTRKMIEDIINKFSNYQPLASNLTTYAGKTPPSGSVVGTSDTQTITNKTIDKDSNNINVGSDAFSNTNLISTFNGTIANVCEITLTLDNQSSVIIFGTMDAYEPTAGDTFRCYLYNGMTLIANGTFQVLAVNSGRATVAVTFAGVLAAGTYTIYLAANNTATNNNLTVGDVLLSALAIPG